ncbi:MAG: hypothetical protein WCB11_20615 [Terriglobales bacterium]
MSNTESIDCPDESGKATLNVAPPDGLFSAPSVGSDDGTRYGLGLQPISLAPWCCAMVPWFATACGLVVSRIWAYKPGLRYLHNTEHPWK